MWRAAVRAVKPGGVIVAKSRSVNPVELPYLDLVQKEVTVKGVHYGSFTQAVELLTGGELRVDDLIGERASLNDYERVLAQARSGEASKQFFVF
jgi:threonine dehydrogenase-like Zn-dependent dehydrogenase